MQTQLNGQGFTDFWQVYQQHYEEISEEMTKDLASDPEFGPIIASMPQAEMGRQRDITNELVEAAMLRQEWDPYLKYMREQGAAYAAMGVSFPVWMKASGAMRQRMIPHLVDNFGSKPDRLVAAIVGMDDFVELALATIGDEYLRAKEEVVAAQLQAIRELSTPVLQLREGLLILPIIGLIDSHRAAQLTEALLRSIRNNRGKVAVVDITGVPDVDSRVANHLVQTVEAARLMGASVILTGISAEIAGTLVGIGVDLSKMHTVGDLQGGIDEADRVLGYQVVKIDGAAGG